MKTDAIRAPFREFFALRASNLADDDDIFEVGGVTSLFVIELLMFVEDEFDIVLGDDDLERDNFRSISALAALVARKIEAPE